MKKPLKYIALTIALAVFTAVACNDYGPQIEGLEKQLEELEKARKEAENSAEALAGLVAALQAEDELLSFSPLADGGEVTGFKVVFKDAGEIVIYNRTANISVGEDGGRYYWMSGGEWLTDASGNRIEITSETPLPQFRLKNGKVEVSVDGGNSFKPLGSIDKCLITSISEDATQVVFTLQSGAVVVIPKQQALKLTINGDDKAIGAGETVTVTYNIEGAENATVTAICGDGWRVQVTPETATSGSISITAPTPIAEDKVIVFAADGKGRMVAVQLRLVADTSTNPDPPGPEVVLHPVVEAYNVTKEGGEVVAPLVTNVDYTVTTDASWLIYTGTKAERTDNLVFTVLPNDDAPRAAVATITSGIYSTAIAFNQAGEARTLEISEHSMTFDIDGGARSLVVTSNIDFNLEVSADWVTVTQSNSVTPSIYIVIVAANPTTEARTATVTFSGDRVQTQTLEITQAGQLPYMTVTGGPTDFGPEGGTATFTVSANVQYGYASDGDWISVAEGETEGSVTQYTVTVSENTGFTGRSATITFSGEGVESKTFTITQGARTPYLTVSPQSLEFGPGGGSLTMRVSSNVDYACDISDGWITVAESSSGTATTYTVSAAANTVTEGRTATITFSHELVETKVVTISQEAMVPYLTLSTGSFSFQESGGTGILTVSANVPFTYTATGEGWLTLAPVGSTGMRFSVSAASNNAFSSRSATITFTAEGVSPQVVTVTQTGKTPYLNVTPSSVTLPANGGYANVTVSSNVQYSVTGGSDWLDISGTPATGNSYFTLTASANSTMSSRSATITFDSAEVGSRVVSVSQLGRTPTLPSAGTGWQFFQTAGNYSYRYGPGIIRHSDGSIDVWTAKEGTSYSSSNSAITYQETGARTKVGAHGHTIAQYFNTQHRFMRVMVNLYGTGTTADAVVLKLYKWAGSYQATLASTPLNTLTISNTTELTSSGTRYSIYKNTGHSWMDPGEYMWTATGATSGVGVFKYTGDGTIALTASSSYLDGEAVSGYNFQAKLRGSAYNSTRFVDRFAYWHSSDGGTTWSDERDVMFPTEGSEDAYSVCDPGAAYFGGWYYIAYTSAPSQYGGTYNHCYVARSQYPTGPWYKWNGSGWGGEPAKIIKFTGTTSQWGAGEPSIVVKDDVIFFYYTWTEGAAEEGPTTRLATAPLSEDWPAHLTVYGTVIDKSEFAHADHCDIKYVEDYDLFYAFHTYQRYRPYSKVAVWTSPDGKNFTYQGDMTGYFQSALGNLGVSADGQGHIRLSEQQFMGYSYGHNADGRWSTWFSPIYFE